MRTQQQKFDEAWKKETAVETERRINELESKVEARIEQRHKDLVSELWKWSESVFKVIQPNSYASVAANLHQLELVSV